MAPEAIVRMVLEGDIRRSEEASVMFSHLTDRERALVREAAVMGYVNGVMGERGHRESIPGDRAIIAEVLLSCRSMRDLYPNLGWLTNQPTPSGNAPSQIKPPKTSKGSSAPSQGVTE